MDEYVGIERNHPESYHSFMYANFFSHVDINPGNINILDGNAGSLAEECLAYEAKIKAFGGIELFLGGVDGDGHIAFNEPGSSLARRTRVKSLAYETILANARFFNGDFNLVTRMALTIGVQTIMEAIEGGYFNGVERTMLQQDSKTHTYAAPLETTTSTPVAKELHMGDLTPDSMSYRRSQDFGF